MEHGDAVAPPQLARDAPVLEVLHPGEIRLRPARGVEGDLAGGDRLGRRSLQLVDSDEPLLGQPRLERRVAAVAVHDGMVMVVHMVEQAVLLEPGDDRLAALVAAHARELAVTFDHVRRLVEDVDLLKAVTLAHAIVVGVMGRGYLHEARAEARIDVEVGEDGDLAVDDGKANLRTDELVLVVVLRGDRHAGVAEHRLGARGGDHDVFLPIDRLDERIAQIPQVAVFFLVLRLVVGDGRRAMRAPVHDALAAVNQPVMVPVAKDLAHRSGVVGIHGEVRIGEVDRAAHALDLLDNVPAVLVSPIPAGVDELLTADLAAGDSLGRELFVHLRLRGDARMVGAQDPAGGDAAHAVHADDGVLDGIVERMAHMKLASHVRRRNRHRAIAHAGVAAIVVASEPFIEHALLDGFCVVILRHVFHWMQAPSMKRKRTGAETPRGAPAKGAPGKCGLGSGNDLGDRFPRDVARAHDDVRGDFVLGQVVHDVLQHALADRAQAASARAVLLRLVGDGAQSVLFELER